MVHINNITLLVIIESILFLQYWCRDVLCLWLKFTYNSSASVFECQYCFQLWVSLLLKLPVLVSGPYSASESSSPLANVSVLVSVEALPLARAFLRQLFLDVPHVKVMFSNIGLDTMLRWDSLCRQFRDTFKYYWTHSTHCHCERRDWRYSIPAMYYYLNFYVTRLHHSFVVSVSYSRYRYLPWPCA